MGAKLRKLKLGKAEELMAAGMAEALSYDAFPTEHWRSLRTNNLLEQLRDSATEAAGGSVSRWAERVDVGGSATAARGGDPMGYPPVLDHGMIEGVEGGVG